MDDLTICKKIAEIEGFEVLSDDEWFIDGYCYILINQCSEKYNPLTDDALCFQLMVKHEMPPMKCKGLYDCYYELDEDVILCGGGFVSDKNPNRAICLAIIEAHKESNNG